jgi:hypothetical protein
MDEAETLKSCKNSQVPEAITRYNHAVLLAQPSDVSKDFKRAVSPSSNVLDETHDKSAFVTDRDHKAGHARIVLYIGIIMLLFGYVDRHCPFYRQPIPRLSVAFWPA